MDRPFTAEFLIFPGFPMSCLTSMIEPLRAANEINGKEAFNWKLVSEVEGKVPSSAGIEFEPSQTLQTSVPPDLLILLSSPTARFSQQSTPATLRALSRHGTIVGAISGGVFPLMRAGISSSQKLAVHWCYGSAFKAEFSNAKASDQVIEIGDKMLTAAGAAAAFELALHLVNKTLGPEIVTEVACWFQHPLVRHDGNKQIVPSLKANSEGLQLPPLVSKAVKIFSENIDEPIGISEIAERLEISERQIERSFKQSTGLSPSHYYRKMRMEAARQLVLYTNDKIPDVAASVGYLSTQPFVRHYTSAHGLTPAEDRMRINQFRYNSNLPVPSV